MKRNKTTKETPEDLMNWLETRAGLNTEPYLSILHDENGKKARVEYLKKQGCKIKVSPLRYAQLTVIATN
jgi:hypothetical protein